MNELNKDQEQAATNIKQFLSMPISDVGNVFTLTGGPGTGKTYMLRQVLEDYKGSVQGATVSHAAKNVLQHSIGSKVECITLASLLGLSQDISDTGEIIFRRSKDRQISSQIKTSSELIILDEVSQIPDSIYKIIMHEIQTYNVKLIAVGDPYQLPPVEQPHDSKFFTNIHARLTIPMRFQGPISELADIYRNQIDNINNDHGFNQWALNSVTRREDNIDNNTGYSFNNKLDAIIEQAADDIKAHPDDLSYARVLAFKNDSVAEINKRIRLVMYGSNLAQFEPNELVICEGGYSSFVGGFRSQILYNGQILKIQSYKHVIGPEEVPCLMMKFSNFDNFGGTPIYVVEDSYEGKLAYDKVKLKLRTSALTHTNVAFAKAAWKRYYSFIESFAYFNFANSLNLYKSQGQTLTNVYVCEGEVMAVKPLTWKQKFQALYVAMTRAKERLYIYNKEF